MIKRPLMSAVMVLTMALTAAGAQGQQYAARRGNRGSVKIGRANINPKSLTGGGSVSVTIPISTRNATITSVTAYATTQGSKRAGATSSLTGNASGQYSGSVAIPVNSKKKRVTSNITVVVESSAGRTKKVVGSVKVNPSNNSNDPNSPPPPPPI